MLREIDVRCIIQNKPNNLKFTNIYFPKVISASTQDEIPFSIPTATIEIVSNSALGTDSYVSPIHEDDIVSLQVSERILSDRSLISAKKNWQEIFSGRIREMKNISGARNTTTLYCVGHIEECDWSLIPTDKAYTTTTDSRDIIVYCMGAARRCMELYGEYMFLGTTVPTYEITAYQSHVSDILTDLEKMSGNTWYADCFVRYDKNHIVNAYRMTWQPLPTTVTNQYQVREKSSRYLESEFVSSIEDLYTAYKVFGDNPPDTTTTQGAAVTQNTAYSGSAINTTAADYYGLRTKTDTFTWVKSNTTAQAIADGVLPGMSQPQISGTIKLIGTPQARKGDLVYVKLPSTEVNGRPVVGNYRVFRVQHDFSGTTFTTTLQVGNIMKTAYDYMGALSKVTQVLKRNFIRKPV